MLFQFLVPIAQFLILCIYFSKLTNFIYFSFLAVLGLHRSPWAFSLCSTWASHCSGFSSCRAGALGHAGFRSCDARTQQSRLAGFVVESSRTRDRTHVPCTGRQILNHQTTNEVPHCFDVQLYSSPWLLQEPSLLPLQEFPSFAYVRYGSDFSYSEST